LELRYNARDPAFQKALCAMDSSHFEKLVQPQQWLQEAFKVVNEYMYARVTELQQILKAENENLENRNVRSQIYPIQIF